MTLSALKTNPKVILFTDFDGTVTLQDSNDYLTDNYGMGKARRVELNQEVLKGTMSFRETFQMMLESVKLPFQQCVDILLENIELDPGFSDFYTWALENNVPVVVLSSGMEPIIRALLGKLVGEHAKSIEIISNQVRLEDNGKQWDIIYHDSSDFGHDKSLAIKPYAELPNRPTLLYAGDGVSDLSAAKETDLLFAKEGRDLVTWCKKGKIAYTEFSSYKVIHDQIKELVEGKATVQDLNRN